MSRRSTDAHAVGESASTRSPAPLQLERYLLPAADRELARYVLDRLLVPHGRRARWLTPLARRVGMRGSATLVGGTRPCGPATEAAGERSWLGDLASEVGRGWLEEVVRGSGLAGAVDPRRWILAGPRPGSQPRRALVFLFPSHGGVPVAVVKVRPRLAPGPDFGGEARALESLGGLPAELTSTVPHLLSHGEHGAWQLLATSALPGRSGYVELHRSFRPQSLVARHLEAAGKWLASFHRATLQGVRPASGDLARLRARGSDPGQGEGLDAWWQGLVGRLEPLAVPLAARHGDFWTRNVLFEELGRGGGRGVGGVVDWEHAAATGRITEDLFHFPWTCAEALLARRGGSSRQTILATAFLERTSTAGTVGRYLTLYCRRLGAVTPEELWPLLQLHIAERAAAPGAAAMETEDWNACLRTLVAWERRGGGIPCAFSG